MRILLLFLLLVSVNLHGYSQGNRPTDVARVTFTMGYVIEEGVRTNQTRAVHQAIFDSLGRLHTEIFYDWETREITQFVWNFYDSLLMVRTELHIDNKLDTRRVFEYNADAMLIRELLYKATGKDTIHARTIVYSYNLNRLPEEIVALDDQGKRAFRIRSSFDRHGTEIKRRVTGRKASPEDKIIRLDRKPDYDSIGLMVSETVQVRMSDRNRNRYTRKYRYDEQFNVTDMQELDNNGSQLSRVDYLWQLERNRILRIRNYDQNDEIERWLLKQYEIYPGSNRRHRIIDY